MENLIPRDVLEIVQNRLNAKYFQVFETDEADDLHEKLYSEIIGSKKEKNNEIVWKTLGKLKKHNLNEVVNTLPKYKIDSEGSQTLTLSQSKVWKYGNRFF